MRMTWVLAEQLMDTLGAVAITAMMNLEGVNPLLNDEDLLEAEKYAKKKFVEILSEWESIIGEEWEIEEEEEND